jgi:parallel beta-helix repeat protein
VAITVCGTPEAADPGAADGKVSPSSCDGAPSSGTRVCGQPILHSPYGYDGPAATFASGEYGLPTYGQGHTDYPSDTQGIVVRAGSNTAAAAGGAYQRAHTIYYFEPGSHVIQQTMYTGDDSVFVGGYNSRVGEATLDGVDGGTASGDGGSFLSLSTAGNVNADQAWEYLTIENYASSQNNAVMGNINGAGFDSGNVYKFDTIGPNEYGYDGANVPPAKGRDNGGGYAIGMSGNTTIEYDCLTQNAQGAYNGFGVNDTISHNEISWNALGEYPDVSADNPKSCGCSGGGKLFYTVNAVVADNYVHNNYNAGIWFDFDNTGADISGNYIASNWGYGIIYEASYNAEISHNTLVGNGWASDGAWPSGGKYQCYGDISCTNGEGPVSGAGGGNPYSAIYLPNSGGNGNLKTVRLPDCNSDCTVVSNYSGALMVTSNTLTNNFGEVMVYTDTNRFPGNLDTDSACSIPLGALDQPNSATYYQQTNVLYTAADATISGATVHSVGGTKTLCGDYGGDESAQGNGNISRAPIPGMAVFNANTGAMVGTIASVASAKAFTLSAPAPSASGVDLVVSAYGGCGPADYYHGGPGLDSGKPTADYWDNCIWGSRNVTVANNTFTVEPGAIKGCSAHNLCGVVGAMVFNAGVPALMRYFDSYSSLIAKASGGLGNVWRGNTYNWDGPGSWAFWVGEQGTEVSQAQWQAAPFGQDLKSRFRSWS